MKWEVLTPKPGDMVRVKLGSIWHYGIYVADDAVVQFGLPPTLTVHMAAEDIAVVQTDVAVFLQSGVLEVAVLDDAEQCRAFGATQVVARAQTRIGDKGYHILHNNCEHFCFECVFGEKRSTQTDDVRALFCGMTQLDVYYAKIPQDVPLTTVYPPTRQAEIAACTNVQVRRQKYCVWRLLAYALRQSFRYDLADLHIEKQENGQWITDRCYFSLSHSKHIVAVAVSRRPVGVDVELDAPLKTQGLAHKILTPEELLVWQQLPEDQQQAYILRCWSGKESEFKRKGTGVFEPSKTAISPDTHTVSLEIDSCLYYLSYTGQYVKNGKIYAVSEGDLYGTI